MAEISPVWALPDAACKFWAPKPIGVSSRVCDNAWVYDDAEIYDNAKVYGDVRVSGNASIFGDLCICDDVN